MPHTKHVHHGSDPQIWVYTQAVAHLKLCKSKLHQEHESGTSQDPRGVHRQKTSFFMIYFEFREFRLCLSQAMAKQKFACMGHLEQADVNEFILKVGELGG